MRISDWSSDVCSSDLGKQDLLSGKYADEIDRLLKLRSALVFRQIGLDNEEQLQFARTLGEVNPLGEDGVSKISLDPKVSSTADYTRGAFYWHIDGANDVVPARSEEHTSELQSLMRISYAVFCLKKKNNNHQNRESLHDITIIQTTETK